METKPPAEKYPKMMGRRRASIKNDAERLRRKLKEVLKDLLSLLENEEERDRMGTVQKISSVLKAHYGVSYGKKMIETIFPENWEQPNYIFVHLIINHVRASIAALDMIGVEDSSGETTYAKSDL